VKHSPLHLISLAAVMSRRRSFRVELGGLLPERRFLKFENGLVVQLSVSPEINETALPSAEAPGAAAQSALTAGPLAHEQGTIHAVAEALQSRGSALAGDLALPNKANFTKIPGLEFSRSERRKHRAGRIRHYALEPHSFRRRPQRQRAGNPCGTRRALPHLLAADFCFHLPTRLLDPGR
jgi:hypothetical protein